MKTKRILTILALAAILCSALAGCSKGDAQSGITVTDILDREVLIPENAEEFVCIGPGCLRLYTYVADTEKIVGVEDMEKDDMGRPYRMAHPEFGEMEIIGAGGPRNAPDAEKLLVADPDVIFTTYNSDAAAVDELQEKTGIPVIALGYGDTAVFDPVVNKSIEIIGEVTSNQERSAEVLAYFDELKADMETRVEGVSEESKPTVYLGAQSMRGMHGIESTSGNFSLFNAIGARNVVDEAGISEYVMLDKEALLEMDPEVIFIDAGGLSLVLEDYKANPSYYEGLQAVKKGRVFMELPYNYYSTNIDTAIADAYFMGSVLYPDQYSDVDPAEKFNEITEKLLGASLYDGVAEDYYGGFQQVVLGE